MSSNAPPPPPLPPPINRQHATLSEVLPPVVNPQGPPGALLLELIIYNGSPFKDHWAYRVVSARDPDIGVVIHATGDVANGFKFEIKRHHDMKHSSREPTRIPLQWVPAEFLDEKAMFNDGVPKMDTNPVCPLEHSLYKVKPPGKSLNVANDNAGPPGRRIVQRNCQTWIIESADGLVNDKILSQEVADYLRAIEQ
ncbi:uncharacterized protein B0I36DRAFT_424323 [Microdochium trichocladiopsis]|uniref:Uncharacterized protein n=1 Tax=Microdochium trichocladiopsis TaxID=1682393 RepID=A0A9P8Y0R4_9PEZI|nr:uncharacterized protein B0I36DRAFT_424323 [Microdochium trichocladiopsis]KAH7026642.1 hypothetical protein B0I36DRAFT_424323 [Microdochium trichocladiopsis]